MTAVVVSGREAGKVCPFCRFALKAGEAAERCDHCQSLHHQDCWHDNHGCAVVGCTNQQTPTRTNFPPPPPPQPPTPVRQKRRKTPWIIAAAAIVLVAAGAAAGAVILSQRHTHTQLANQPELRTRLIAISADQQTLNTLLQGLTPATPLTPLRQAGNALSRDVAQAQQYAETLTTTDPQDQTTLTNLTNALRAEHAYAQAIATLPTALTKPEAESIVNTARQAQTTLAILHQTNPTLPRIPANTQTTTSLLGHTTNPQPPPASPPPPPPPPVLPPPSPSPSVATAFSTFTGSYFTVAYPSDWHVDTAEVNKGSYYDTTITDPADQALLLRVDVSPNAPPGLDANARPVVADLKPQPGYRQLQYTHSTLNGYDTVYWEFLVREHNVLLHKIDIFFIDQYGDGLAVLAQAPETVWSAWKPVFDQFFQSMSTP